MEEVCKVDWCNNKPNRSGKKYCRMHYDQIRKYGKIINYRPVGKRNEYIIKEKYAELHILDKNGNIKQIAIIDIEDIEKLKQYSFRIHNNGYITSVKNGKTLYLHQIVFENVQKGFEIDHINRNKLDNRKMNLRECRHIDNTHNRKSYNKFGQQGIKKIKRNLNKSYMASIINNKKFIFLGYYRTKEEAIKAREKAEKEIYKGFSTVKEKK